MARIDDSRTVDSKEYTLDQRRGSSLTVPVAALWSTDNVGAREGEFAPDLAVVVRAGGGNTVTRGCPGPGGAQGVSHAGNLALLGGRGSETLR